ncbi:GAF domain-containing sensor histidine kinase [Rhodohalobacter sp. 614A]|uniref:GAF domain-containing sensor histidine kinase n=1 Tax=Rhodohalobacter sp. 614A TaxID=2908649 RepID=UPI001F2AD443|nr:GAF domain-containing sensor histidine kinase [Rhodohalobacter sp. 614A]
MSLVNEQDRLKALYSYNILDTESEVEFDELTELAASICNAPIAMINLVDDEHQWAKSIYGLNDEVKKIPREKSICQYSILENDLLEIPDIMKDGRFEDLPHLKQNPNIIYYIGAQLLSPEGYAIGSLCVMDTKKRHLDETKKRQLKIVANQVMTALELRKQNEQLTELNNHQVNLMKILSHDLRSPLSGIIGMSDLLEEMVSSSDNETLEMVSLLNQSAKQLNQLINDILNYTIIDSKGFSLHPRQANVHAVAENMKRLYMPSAKLKNIDLTFDVDVKDKDIWIDEEKFEQIFGNLLSNAIKFTIGGGSVHSSLKVENENGNKRLLLNVTDTGTGMAPDFVENLFSNHSHNNKEGTSGEKSTGLGLSIIKHFTELHNGNIDVDSRPGDGTTFKISLPLNHVNPS